MAAWDRLVRVSAPATSALTLEAAKAHLKVEGDHEDVEIQAMVDAAVALVDGPRGRGFCLITQTWRLTLDRFTRFIHIPLGPNAAIVSVKFTDADGVEQTIDDADYQLLGGGDPAVLSPAYGKVWPTARCEPGAVRITFTAGFGAAASSVPGDLVAALKLVVGAFYRDRETATVPAGADAVFNRYGALSVA
jgi:uncharacterized phiE125 gp8 family phage protein